MKNAFRNRRVLLATLPLIGLIGSAPASAALDVTSVTAAVSDASTAGATIGLAVLVMIVGLKVFKWVRRAL